MFARSVSIRLKTNRVAEFTHLIADTTLPVPRKHATVGDEHDQSTHRLFA
jgi:hypothetical protein